jgi:hypothetical protein
MNAPRFPLVNFRAMLTWPVRPNIVPFECGVQDKFPARVRVSFPATYSVVKELILSGQAWTCLEVEWSQPFGGGAAAANKWIASDKGAEAVMLRMESISSELINSLRAMYPADRNLAGLRSFGMRDWPIYSFGVHDFGMSVRIGIHAEHQFRSVPTLMFDGAECSLVRTSTFSTRAILRASDLAEGGYPTEASLIAFGALDVAVQRFVLEKMRGKGVSADAADSMLRNITTKRLITYLDSVLMLACGRSLKQDAVLFDRLISANRARNDAIHNGYELGRVEAVEVIDCVASIFVFLREIDPSFESGFVKPVFYC